MQEYKVSKEDETEYSGKPTIEYSRKFNGYIAATRLEKKKMFTIDYEQYLRWLAGEVKHIFPEYNQKTQYISPAVYGSDFLASIVAADKLIPMFLYEYIPGTSVEIPYGTYRIVDTNDGPVLKTLQVNKDKYITFERDYDFDLVHDFKEWVKGRKGREERGKRNKSSTLFYGPGGNGKTRDICRLMEIAETEKFYIIYVPSNVHFTKLEPFREALKQENVVFILEEITERASDRKTNAIEQILSFLDGEMSWNNCYVVATTNYPEELPFNIVDRPGRFRNIIKVDNPSARERAAFLRGMGVAEAQIDAAVKVSKDFSIDYLVCAIDDAITQNITVVKALKSFIKTRKKVKNHFKESTGRMGIGSDDDGYDDDDDLMSEDDMDDRGRPTPPRGKVGI